MNEGIKKELLIFIEKITGIQRYVENPILWDANTGDPVKFEKIPIYFEPRDQIIGLSGSFNEENRVDNLTSYLMGMHKEKKVIVVDKWAFFPVYEDGGIRYYRLSEYIKL